MELEKDADVREREKETVTVRNSLTGTTFEEYVNQDTGEHVRVRTSRKRIHTGKHFWKCFMTEFLEDLSFIKSKQLAVVSFIIKNLNASTNYYVGTYDDIIKGVGVSRETVASVMKGLQETNFLRMKQVGVWMVNPNVLIKGNEAKQDKLCEEYYGYGDNTVTNVEAAADSEQDNQSSSEN